MAATMGNLEESVHMYQKNHSSEALDEVVTLLDGVVLGVVHHMLRVYQGAIDLEFDDLYQIGIIGLIRALGTLPEGYDEDEIRMRVVAYVKAEISKKFRESKRRFLGQRRILYGDGSISDASMHLRVEVKELFSHLISTGVITREDFYFLYHRFVDEISVRELAKHYGKTSHGIMHWERRLLKTLRQDMSVRGFANAKDF